MKVREILSESMTMWIPKAPVKRVRQDCFVCDGGQNKFEGKVCPACKDAGYYMDDQSEGPEINMSNANARTIMSVLGYEPDDGYTIPVDQIPIVKRRIVELLNKQGSTSAYTRADTDTRVDHGMVHSKDPVTGLDRIERKTGPRVIDFGIDEGYIHRRLQEILELLDYAQKLNAEVVIA